MEKVKLVSSAYFRYKGKEKKSNFSKIAMGARLKEGVIFWDGNFCFLFFSTLLLSWEFDLFFEFEYVTENLISAKTNAQGCIYTTCSKIG